MSRGTDLKMQIPECLADARDGPLLGALAQGGVVQEKHVHVGIREQRLTPISTESRNANPVGPGRVRTRSIPQIAYQRIGKVRALIDCSLPVMRVLESRTYSFRFNLIFVLRYH